MDKIATNKKAFHNYHIEEKVEAGIVLKGSEAKAIRNGNVNINDSYAIIRNEEVFLVGMNVSPLAQASVFNHQELRMRKLLLHSEEIRKLDRATRTKGYTLVPLDIYFNERGMIKLTLALAKGKAEHDKRETIKKKEANREMARAARQQYSNRR